jgi:hypothetical protein
LTLLRKTYTTLRNRARSRRRGGTACRQYEKGAREATRTYHITLRRQKKAYWEDFLTEDTNIWSAARFMKPEKQSAFSRVPSLRRTDGSYIESREEQAKEMLQTFFPPLPAATEEEESADRQRPEAPMPELEQAEIRSLTQRHGRRWGMTACLRWSGSSCGQR